MNKKEYAFFRLVINLLVFTAFLLVFLFVEIKNLQGQSVIRSFITTLVLSTLLLFLGIFTLFEAFSAYFGRTLIVFSILIFAGAVLETAYKSFSIYILIEMILSFASFLYGRDLVSQGGKFISLKVIR